MESMDGKNLRKPDEVRTLPKLRMEVVEVGDFTMARVTWDPGWRWSEHVKPTVGSDSCQVHHKGVFISGRMRVRMNDGVESEFGPGDVFDIPPGHDGWVIGDESVVGFEFGAAKEYGKAH
jgi:hypothetical protein